MSDLFMDLTEFYAGRDLKWFVVEIEAGPRRRPTYKSKRCVRTANSAKARESVKRALASAEIPIRSPRLSVRYAHPASDLRLKRSESFTPIDPDAPLPTALRSSLDMYRITCRCGHSADFDEFCTTPSGVELPRNEFQCRRCFKAWRIEAVGEGWTTPEGLYIPPDRKCVAILPRL